MTKEVIRMPTIVGRIVRHYLRFDRKPYYRACDSYWQVNKGGWVYAECPHYYVLTGERHHA